MKTNDDGKPRIDSIVLADAPIYTQYCHACGQIIGNNCKYARIMVDLGLGGLLMPISVHIGCVNTGV